MLKMTDMQHRTSSSLSCSLAMQGADWSPFVVTDGKLITGQNPQVRSADFRCACMHMHSGMFCQEST